GYSSGATLVYATLVQAPSTTFGGAISLGFCPDLPLSKPLCKGSGLEWQSGRKGKGFSFLPAANLEVPWIALQGTSDQVCNSDSTAKYVKQVKQGELVMLPKVGHGFSVQKNWMPQFKQAFARLAMKSESEPGPHERALQDLPLIEVPCGGDGGNLMALHITGDGGWGVTDKGLSNTLAAHGIPVVGLNSLKYFWTKRTPEGTANDVERLLRHYLSAWKKEKLILIGYSFGADVLPFVVNRLPDELRAKVELLVFLGPSATAQFEFHLANWLGDAEPRPRFMVQPEIEKLHNMRMLCFCGDEEKDSLCQKLAPRLVKTVVRKGGHRLGGNYAPVAEEILREVQ
ncbi:virulence factor family protein, partial [candidate division KSB1 bacterium]|nr:virulence factor family protein [candidate division KSB1 bacterium]